MFAVVASNAEATTQTNGLLICQFVQPSANQGMELCCTRLITNKLSYTACLMFRVLFQMLHFICELDLLPFCTTFSFQSRKYYMVCFLVVHLAL